MRPFSLRPFAAVFAALFLLPCEARALVISELMASNATTITDEDGEYSDWVEIFNNSASTANLGGMYLTDDESLPTKWQFPATTLGAGQYLIVWTSDKNRQVSGQPLHTNFKLSSSGEYLGLIAADGTTVIDEYVPSFPAMSTDRSYGLASDLVTERCFIIPTPGAANNETADCVTTAPVTFSPARGYYDAPIAVTISTATPGATINYTTDGSDPTPTHGTPYTAPISVTTNAMIRAMAFGPGLDPTPSVTHTYIYLNDILTQTIADQPPEYLFAGADYDMDPDVVNDPRYASEIIGDLKAIPALSIVTDVDHLFGPQNGIYNHRLGTGVEWERPTSVEMIRDDGAAGFQINCGIRIQGGVSRLSDMGKYSLRLLFKSIYGPSKLVYPFFPDSPVDSFDTITLTATHGNSWPAGFSRAEYIRDTWLKDTQLAMGQASAHTTYVQLFINGRYWGMYRPTERPSGPFLASYFGGVEEDYDALNAGKVIDGDRNSWDTLQDLAAGPVETLAGYDAVRQYLDVDNFSDYMISNIYAANYDWPEKNWYAGRKREAGAGFRFFNWDGEDTFNSPNANRVSLGAIDTPGAVYANLRKSPEFRLAFADRVHKHFFNGGALTPEAAKVRWRKRRDQIYHAIVGESARWGDHRRTIPYTRDIEWIAENQRLLLNYFPARTRIQVDQFRSAGLYPSVDAPEFSKNGGQFFAGDQVTISGPAGAVIWVTTDGSDPRIPGGAVSPSASPYSGAITLSAAVTIRARALSSGNVWSAISDTAFTPVSPLRITELMYNPSAGTGAEYLEIRNISASPVSLAGVRLTAGVTFNFPATMLGAGAVAVAVESTTTFPAVYGPGHPVLGQYSGRLDNGGERITLVAADNSVIHDFEYDDAWYPSTDGPGRSLVIRDATADLSAWGLASGWKASAMNAGTPGSVEPPHCSNGIDDDGDGFIDLADAGCAGASAETEVPECNDGIDNDADGTIDMADLQCSSASHATEAPDAGDSFLCYAAKQGQPFAPVEITIDDELDGAVSYELPVAQSICVAGERDGTAAIDDSTHLRSYPLKPIDGEPLHVPLFAQHYDSALGPFYLDIGKPLRLLAPAVIDLAAPVSSPDFGSHGVDFYKCYRASLSKNLPRYFPPNAQVHFEDLFESRDYVLRPPTQVCVPAAVDGPVKTPGRHLLCYKAARSKLSPVHIPALGVNAADLFAESIFSTSREAELCVPAVPVAD
ncbi:MAG TPA: lamin tail domain-containing protein [Candidatus Limnocylindrales bacterium]|nr:lamin tail domain-containing protein [Candidatus Limnocylindrales bacterium]